MPIRRLPAEWEPQSFVQLTFPHADTDWADMLEPALVCFTEIAAAITRFQDVLIVGRNAESIAQRFSPEQLARIRFSELPTNDTWARDHGGITIEEDGRPVVLEVNTLPGMTETSLLPKAAAVAGLDFPALCEEIAGLSLSKRKP